MLHGLVCYKCTKVSKEPFGMHHHQLHGAMFHNTDLHSHRFETPKSQKQMFLRITDTKNVL